MNYLIIYTKATGEIVGYKTPVKSDLIDDSINGSMIVDIDPSQTCFYIKNGVVAQRPPRPANYYYWDGNKWIINDDIAAQEIISKRNNLLLDSDWTELIGSEKRLGDILYKKWQQYRQDLRDITDQADFPLNIVWPTKPV